MEKNKEKKEVEIKEEQKPKKKGNTVAIILIVLALICFGCYFAISKGIFNPKETNEANEPKGSETSNNEQLEVKDINSEKIYETNGELVDASYKLGDKEVAIKMEREAPNDIVMLDGTEIFKTEFGNVDKHAIETIHIMGDIIIITTTGTDIRTYNIYIFDNNGNQIKTIKNSADDDSRMKMSKYGVVDNRITFTRTMISHGLSIDNTTEIFDFSTCKDLLKENNIPEGLVVEADYEIKYLGNNKFSEEINTKKVTIEEYVNSEDIKQYCN